jgi:type IV pilus biogenesis protein CpaD/CtpE
MNRATLSSLASLALGLVSGCGDNDSHTNGAVLWLAPDQAETRVKLVEDEPNPY